MIPKVIHYCWFGGAQYPEVVKKCIESWKKYCPDYELKLWNEENYDVNTNDYCREAFLNRKWAFVSDYARLDILYRYGGFYLDTDVELVRSLDDLRELECFVASDGDGINTGLGCGADAYNDIIKAMRDLYQNKSFLVNGKYDTTPCTVLNSKIFLDNGYNPSVTSIEKICGVSVLPYEYFSPIRGTQSELQITVNTHGIHWGSRLWETGWTRIKANIRIKLGIEKVNKIKKMLRR